MKAIKLLLNKTSNFTFLLIGDGPDKSNLERIAQNEIKSGNVVFAGSVDHKLLINNKMLSIGDVFFSASTSENQSISALEAMSEGLPLVVADMRGMPELVDGNGFVCKAGDVEDMADKLFLLLSDEVARKKMSLRSLEMSRNYGTDVVANRLAELYEKTMATKKPRRSYREIIESLKR